MSNVEHFTIAPRKPWQHRPTNDNATFVASFDGQTPVARSAYEAELREYENSRAFRDTDSLMRERSAVRL